jgi:hypothetical protein
MAKYLFEKAMSVSFTAQAGGETIAPYALVSARLYSSAPTAAQKVDDDGVGAVEKIESWTAGDSTNEKLIAFSAVVDPDSTSTSRYAIYHVAVGYTLEDGGTTVYDVLPIMIWRIKAIGSRFGVAASDLVERESKLSAYNTGTLLTDKISDAEDEVDTDITLEGYRLEDVAQSDLFLLVLLKAIELKARDLMNEPGDSWGVKAEFYAERYAKRLKTIRIRHDQDGDGIAEESEATINRTFVSTFR